jgi:P-loop Domain of unknown function (DUF2791)
MVNLFKLSSAAARSANYEQILRIINDGLQGSAAHLGFLFGGTPDFLADPRRGLYSYPALQSRLAENTFATGGLVDYSGPVLREPGSGEDDQLAGGQLTQQPVFPVDVGGDLDGRGHDEGPSVDWSGRAGGEGGRGRRGDVRGGDVRGGDVLGGSDVRRGGVGAACGGVAAGGGAVRVNPESCDGNLMSRK